MAEDIDFKYPMKRACAWEIATLCGHVPHGHARIVRCLQENLSHEDMSK
jgi:golgi apparatus protein 1